MSSRSQLQRRLPEGQRGGLRGAQRQRAGGTGHGSRQHAARPGRASLNSAPSQAAWHTLWPAATVAVTLALQAVQQRLRDAGKRTQPSP